MGEPTPGRRWAALFLTLIRHYTQPEHQSYVLRSLDYVDILRHTDGHGRWEEARARLEEAEWCKTQLRDPADARRIELRIALLRNEVASIEDELHGELPAGARGA